MMRKYVFCCILIFTSTQVALAQFTRYLIHLKDKTGTPYTIQHPQAFLSQRAIDRRSRYNISVDSTDLPVTPAYLDSIRSAGSVTILNVSKWLNQVCIKTTDAAALNKISHFSFVQSVPPVAARPAIPLSTDTLLSPLYPLPTILVAARAQSTPDYYDYGAARAQIYLNQGQFLHNHGFRGENMVLSITDDGFYHYQTLPQFDSIRSNHQILGTWDFVANDSTVNPYDTHGAYCLGLIAANLPGTIMGAAPQVSLYLYRTEDITSEYPIEEQNWIAATERADSAGTDVLSVSLGYSTFDSSRFDYTYNDLNGHTTPMAEAANMAARKGILVTVACGNYGATTWHYLTTPADADSVLSVGATDTFGIAASFSSYGPNSNGQVKPDVAAVGAQAAIANASNGQPAYSNGTSFACPLMAGLSTCLWQAFPEVNNMQLINVLRQASNHYDHPDDRTGYGIPNMKKAFVLLIRQLHTMEGNVTGNTVTLNWSAKSATDMSFVVERKHPADTIFIPVDTLSACTGFQTNAFSFTENLSSATPIIYRIRMNIAHDTSFYLDTFTIASNNGITLTPNPMHDHLTIRATQDLPQKLDIRFYTTDGKIIDRYESTQPAGTYTLSIPVNNLSAGSYIITIYTKDRRLLSQTVVKE